MDQNEIHRIVQENGETLFDSPLAIAIIWPIIFAVLEVLFNSLSGQETRDGDKKFKITYFEDGEYFKLYPLDRISLKKELNKRADIPEIDMLPSGFWQTSLGIDLCIGAISTSFANLLVFARTTQTGDGSSSLLITSIIVLASQFVLLSILVKVLRQLDDKPENQSRLFYIQVTNLMGLLALAMSFYTLGRIIF